MCKCKMREYGNPLCKDMGIQNAGIHSSSFADPHGQGPISIAIPGELESPAEVSYAPPSKKGAARGGDRGLELLDPPPLKARSRITE